MPVTNIKRKISKSILIGIFQSNLFNLFVLSFSRFLFDLQVTKNVHFIMILSSTISHRHVKHCCRIWPNRIECCLVASARIRHVKVFWKRQNVRPKLCYSLPRATTKVFKVTHLHSSLHSVHIFCRFGESAAKWLALINSFADFLLFYSFIYFCHFGDEIYKTKCRQ